MLLAVSSFAFQPGLAPAAQLSHGRAAYQVVTTHSRHALVVAEEADEAMPALLGEWGYDAALWSQIRSKRILLEWAQDGGAEAEVKAKERLATIRQMTSAEAAPMPAFLAQVLTLSPTRTRTRTRTRSRTRSRTRTRTRSLKPKP